MYNLCCISNELKEQGYKFKTMTWKRFNQLCDEHGAEYALDQVRSALAQQHRGYSSLHRTLCRQRLGISCIKRTVSMSNASRV